LSLSSIFELRICHCFVSQLLIWKLSIFMF
jgi:hypothetical protein